MAVADFNVEGRAGNDAGDRTDRHSRIAHDGEAAFENVAVGEGFEELGERAVYPGWNAFPRSANVG